jgi:hypothetical protein
MKLIHYAELLIELTNGNDGRGGKWFSSAKMRKQIEALLIATGHRREPFDVPVSLLITRVMASASKEMGRRQLAAWKPERADRCSGCGWVVF